MSRKQLLLFLFSTHCVRDKHDLFVTSRNTDRIYRRTSSRKHLDSVSSCLSDCATSANCISHFFWSTPAPVLQRPFTPTDGPFIYSYIHHIQVQSHYTYDLVTQTFEETKSQWFSSIAMRLTRRWRFNLKKQQSGRCWNLANGLSSERGIPLQKYTIIHVDCFGKTEPLAHLPRKCKIVLCLTFYNCQWTQIYSFAFLKMKWSLRDHVVSFTHKVSHCFEINVVLYCKKTVSGSTSLFQPILWLNPTWTKQASSHRVMGLCC